MQNEIIRKIEAGGCRAMFVSIGILDYMKANIAARRAEGGLNPYQEKVLDNYGLELPDAGFCIQSILLVAYPGKLFRLNFRRGGISVSAWLPPTYSDFPGVETAAEKLVSGPLADAGFRGRYAERLPYKLLAALSGFGRYGRNNICYVEGLGSFHTLVPFYTDVPCADVRAPEALALPACDTCTLCRDACPTGAIRADRFLIDCERCLTWFNERKDGEFPAWIPAAAHNSLVGCAACQLCCPYNEMVFGTVSVVDFSEQETSCLMDGMMPEDCPESLRRKADLLGLRGYWKCYPKNLRALFAGHGG
jgi:epoxyqueuosine reductase